ncbi:secretion system protein [Candidatus Saccharibacteria bacterium]|nr:MAG: secretion system protein [Candidatus Saccharibacteria bacterium]
MLFSYKALRKNNSSVSGTIEAADRDAAMAALSHQGLHPLLVSETNAKRTFGVQKKVKSNDMVVFTRQLSTMISAGVPIAKGLATLQDSSNSAYFREVLGKITKDIEGGTQLGDAFAKFPNVFDEVYVNMVRAGEEGGILDDILKRLATQVEQNASIKKKIRSAMIYPIVILCITVIAFFGIMFFIMPKIAKILKDLGGPDAQLPVYTQVLLDISNFSRKYAFIVIPVMLLAAWTVKRYIQTTHGKYQFHALLLRIPVIKTIVTKVAIARFSRTFASLMSAGVGVLDSLSVTGGAIGNKVIEKELAEAAAEVKNGKQLSEVIGQSPHFPKIVAQMLAVGEETGTTDTVLLKVADFYEEEVATAIDGLASVIEPVMILFLGSGVGVIAASVMGPIASLSNNIGN